MYSYYIIEKKNFPRVGVHFQVMMLSNIGQQVHAVKIV